MPLAVYVDLKNIYVSPGPKGEAERVLNAFERVCDLLDVKIMKAYSPQAKGRVERSHGTYQDRFVKELKLRGIKTLEEANSYLKASYLEHHNQKFAKTPHSGRDVHISPSVFGDLDQILCWESTRTIQQDWTLSHEKQLYQMKKRHGDAIKPGDKVQVRKHLDGRSSIWKGDTCLQFNQIDRRPERKLPPKAHTKKMSLSEAGRKGAQNSPWRQFNPDWLKPKDHLEHQAQ